MALTNLHEAAVLVVEDNHRDAEWVIRTLERYGVREAFVATNGDEALSILARQPCDVALVDYHLPGMNGMTLLQRIRETHPETAVILVTGARDERVAIEAFRQGAADYVPKDEYLTSGLTTTLQKVLRARIGQGQQTQHELLANSRRDLERVRVEAEWLLQVHGCTSAHVPLTGAGGLAHYGDELWNDAVQTLAKYLIACSPDLDENCSNLESALMSTFFESGLSPRDLLLLYHDAVATLVSALQVNPTVSFAGLQSRIIDEYQRMAAVRSVLPAA